MSWTQDKKELRAWFKKRYWWTRLFPLIFLTKDNILGWVLKYTFGLFVGPERFMKDFANGAGIFVLIPKEWSTEQAKSVGCHEIGGHIFHTFIGGLCLPVVGPLLGMLTVGFLYLLVLPAGFNWFRYAFERNADKQKWKYMLEQGATPEQVLARAESFGSTVCSKAYGWPYPKGPGAAGFKREATKILEGKK